MSTPGAGRPAVALASLAVLGLACARTPRPAPSPSTAEDLLAPYAPVRLGATSDELRAALPSLAPTGWTSGDRSTLIDPTRADGLEVELRGDRVEAAALTFGPSRARAVARTLAERLGPGLACGGLPEAAGAYTPRLYRLADGSGLTVLDKGLQLTVHVARPATAAFAAAYAACSPDGGAGPRP